MCYCLKNETIELAFYASPKVCKEIIRGFGSFGISFISHNCVIFTIEDHSIEFANKLSENVKDYISVLHPFEEIKIEMRKLKGKEETTPLNFYNK